MVLLTAEFFCGVNNDIASSRGCRHGRHGFPSRLPRVATSTVVGPGPQRLSASVPGPKNLKGATHTGHTKAWPCAGLHSGRLAAMGL